MMIHVNFQNNTDVDLSILDKMEFNITKYDNK